MADLIRNPNSQNVLYIPQEDFPFQNSTGSSITLNDDGTMTLDSVSGYTTSIQMTFDFDGSQLKTSSAYFLIGGNTFVNQATTGNVYLIFRTSTLSEVTTREINVVNGSSIVVNGPDGNAVRFYPIGNISNKGMIKKLSIIIYLSSFRGVMPLMLGLYDGVREEQWESAYMEEKYTITFHDPSGTNADVIYRNCELGISTPTPPSWTRTGYELVGWKPNIADTVTQDQTYVAQWATEGSDSLPITLKQLRQWEDSNEYSDGVGMNRAVTLRQDALLLGGDASSSVQDVGDCVVTVAQFKELSKRLSPLTLVAYD